MEGRLRKGSERGTAKGDFRPCRGVDGGVPPLGFLSRWVSGGDEVGTPGSIADASGKAESGGDGGSGSESGEEQDLRSL